MPERAPRSYSVSWGNPYTEPPAGLPRTQLVTRSRDEALSLLDYFGSGSGFSLFVLLPVHAPDPRRQWSPERKATTRRKRLRRRIEKKHPLFSDQLYEEELARRPGYFAGEDPTLLPLNQQKEQM